ncbi:AAA family ATPase [Oscillatoriales cyanobacterium LEGE 11467]|uniref:Nuclease SbcCD subunit C n=1 Tax=Zarconia navalis LEGE 11467 TaxID=1828826 RepID=A0A928VUE1_9CYAN|nr:AAA family ATPase [Zarconia navalis]MBE9039629.1 AAA family ATPase [Zarconia navalis LEGE 11467]
MKLTSIKFFNFRQFYGETPDVLISDGSKNTTVVHGNNGAGKTTLMNGFTWVFYEKLSPDFALPEELANKRAIAESNGETPVTYWVEVVFEHDGRCYQAKRRCRAYKNKLSIEQGESQLTLQVAREDGRWMLPPESSEDIISRILPESLYPYFFFNGERIEKIVRDDKKSEIATATKELLGVEVIIRAIRHLGEAKKSLETHLRGIGNPETQNLLRQKQTLENELVALDRRKKEIEEELTDRAQIKKTLSGRLIELGGAEELQRLRNELETQATTIKEQLASDRARLEQLISTQGYSIFLGNLTAQFRSTIEGLRERGELPAGIKKQFVLELLDRQSCICGVPLRPESVEYDRVRSWMEKAGVAAVEETAIWMNGQVDEIDKQAANFWQEVDRLCDRIDRDRTKLSRQQTQLEDVKEKLRNFPDEDIQQLQKQLDSADKRLSNLNRETGSNQQLIDSLHAQVSQLEKQVDKQRMNERRQVLAQRRIAAALDAIERLTTVRRLLEQKFRISLEKRVQELFAQISFTPYTPKLNQKYELTLVENTAGIESNVAASTGENQILSLSFIGGIIDGVREWSQKNTLMGPDSSTFPVVMDSPFGSLDEIYRRQVTKWIPQLANQLVVLVSKTQWRGEFAEEIADRVGREYVLSYNSSKPDCEEDSIELGGVSYPLVRRSPNGFDYTEIIEVER